MKNQLILALVITAALAPAAAFATAPQPEPAQACYDLYQPVCAAHQVECFAAPCYPVYKTYSNSCFAGLENARIIHQGECTTAETGFIKPVATTTTTGTTTTTTSTSTATSSAATTTLPTTQSHSFLYRCWHAFLSWFTR